MPEVASVPSRKPSTMRLINWTGFEPLARSFEREKEIEREENQLGHIPRLMHELYHTHYKAVGTTPFTWHDRMYASEDGYQYPSSLLKYCRLGIYVDIPAGKQGRYIRTIQYNNAS